MSKLEHFKPSGRTTPQYVGLVIVALLLIIGLAWPYQRLMMWVPFIYINLLIYLGFIVAVAFSALMAASIGKNRNRILGAVMGLVIGAAGVGASHYVAYKHTQHKLVGTLEQEMHVGAAQAHEIASQLTFSNYVELKVATGWSLGRMGSSGKGDLHGVFVWIFWAIEALGLLLAGAIGGASVDPFCEHCNTSLEERKLFTRGDLDATHLGALKSAAVVDDLIVPVQQLMAPPPFQVQYSVYACPKCDGPGYLTLKKKWQEQGKDGLEDKSEDLHSNVVITRPQLARLDALRDELAAAGARVTMTLPAAK